MAGYYNIIFSLYINYFLIAYKKSHPKRNFLFASELCCLNNKCIYNYKNYTIMEKTVLTKWAIDPTHSEVQFKVKHLVISTVTGKFNEFSGSIDIDGDDFSNASAEFTAKIDSLTTGNADRDGHLKSDDFFNAESYPELKFKSTEFKKIDEHNYKVTGDLTIRNTTRKVELSVVYGGTVNDPYGNTKAGFEITGKINRKEFGLKWDAVTEAGSVVVSDEVKLDLNIQVVKG